MEKNQHLAIASVPVQTWNEVYDEAHALRKGTIFGELNRPFYATVLDDETLGVERSSNQEAQMLLQIQRAGFVLDDLRLYLDTHPEEKEALKLYKDTLKRKMHLMREFALRYYPLAEVCMEMIYDKYPESECYCWQEGKIPWEGACS